MRIAFFGKGKRRTRTTTYIVEALRRQGHEVFWVKERRRRALLGEAASSAWTLRSVARFRPDFVLIHATDASRRSVEALAPRYKTVMFTPDCWPSPLAGRGLELARRVDLLLSVAKGQLPEFLAAGVRRAEWLAEACDPSAHHPIDAVDDSWSCDVAFVGKANAGDARYVPRCELVRAVSERFETHVYGGGWGELGIRSQRDEVGPDDYRRVCRGARVVLGRDWNDSCELYFSNRTWFTLGCRGFMVTNYVPGLERVFGNHEELVWYRSPDECLEQIERYLARPDERQRVAQAGHTYALAHRTYDHFARDLVDLVGGKPAGFPPAR